MDEPDGKILLDLLHTMLLIRRFEEKIVEVYGVQDMKTPVHLCVGQEAIAAGVCANLRKDDYLFTTHRGHGHCLAKGADPKVLFAEFYGRVDGCCRGKGGSMHPVDPENGILGASAIVGGAIPLAAGAALAAKMKKTDRVAVVFFGDGASEEGVFQETLNFSALKALPAVFVCEKNYYATNSHLSARQAHDDIARRAEAYGLAAERLDGNDVVAVYQAASLAVARARAGKGPTLLDCKTYRWYGHVGPVFDYKTNCRPKEELDEWMARCPVKVFTGRLMQKRLISQDSLDRTLAEIDSKMAQAIEFGRASHLPDAAELTQHLFHQNAK